MEHSLKTSFFVLNRKRGLGVVGGLPPAKISEAGALFVLLAPASETKCAILLPHLFLFNFCKVKMNKCSSE